MSLRLQINLAITVLMLLFLGALFWLEIDDARRSVREEIEASSRVAGHLLTAVIRADVAANPIWVRDFLARVGRIRANEVELIARNGALMYRSPPPTYKAGRAAPAWYAALVSPPAKTLRLRLPMGELRVTSDPSRSVLDAWDDLGRIALISAGFLIVVNVAAFWFAGRALAPIEQVVEGLQRMESGALDTRLAPTAGREARVMAESFNRMAAAVQETVRMREAAERSRAQLAERQALAREVQAHVEEERRALARELHDEFGQTVTAIRSVVASLEPVPQPEATTRGLAIIKDLANRLYDGMHRLVPRLRPMALDDLGLAAALAELVQEQRVAHPGLAVQLEVEGTWQGIPDEVAIALYRVAQEGLTNVVRHAAAARCTVALTASGESIRLTVADDGRGGAAASGSGRFGLRGMRERVESLGGTLEIRDAPGGGTLIAASVPLPVASGVAA